MISFPHRYNDGRIKNCRRDLPLIPITLAALIVKICPKNEKKELKKIVCVLVLTDNEDEGHKQRPEHQCSLKAWSTRQIHLLCCRRHNYLTYLVPAFFIFTADIRFSAAVRFAGPLKFELSGGQSTVVCKMMWTYARSTSLERTAPVTR